MLHQDKQKYNNLINQYNIYKKVLNKELNHLMKLIIKDVNIHLIHNNIEH